MTYEHIRQLLETTVKDFVDNYAQQNNIKIDVSYENVSYEPKVGTTYIKSEIVPNTKRPVTIGQNPQELIRGLLVLTPHAPSGKGPLEADKISDAIMNTSGFRATDVLSNSSGSIIIEYTERNRGFLEAPWYYVPIFIAWRVFKQ